MGDKGPSGSCRPVSQWFVRAVFGKVRDTDAACFQDTPPSEEALAPYVLFRWCWTRPKLPTINDHRLRQLTAVERAFPAGALKGGHSNATTTLGRRERPTLRR